MGPIVISPDPPPDDVVRCLDMAGCRWIASTTPLHPTEPWIGAVVSTEGGIDAAFEIGRSLRHDEQNSVPVLLVVRGSELALLADHPDAFDDFCVTPFHPVEFEARLRHLLVHTVSAPSGDELITSGPLVLNVETYQAQIDGRLLDLTYMEYALLKFLASSPGRVFTREALLSQVWGYEYYGGARTVDVHIRRLRAKLGEEHAALIQTVRSVGYRFGESRW